MVLLSRLALVATISTLFAPVLVSASPITYLGTFPGNDSDAAIERILGLDVTWLAKFDPYGAAEDKALEVELFDVILDNPKSGSWSFDGFISPGLAWYVDYFAIKGGPNFALYAVAEGLTSGGPYPWDTNHLFVGNGTHPSLSHISWYGRTEPTESVVPEPPPDILPVSEPTSIFLLGSGLLGIGYHLRRKKATGT